MSVSDSVKQTIDESRKMAAGRARLPGCAAWVAAGTLIVGAMALLFAISRAGTTEDSGDVAAGLGLIAAALAFGLLTNAMLRR